MSKTPALHFFYGKAVLFAALHLKGNVIACGAVGMHRAAYGRVPARINARALRNHRRRHGEARGIVFLFDLEMPFAYGFNIISRN